jgi:hypothetical protein
VFNVVGLRVRYVGFGGRESSSEKSRSESVRVLVEGGGGAPMMLAEEMERRHCCVLDADIATFEICDQHDCLSDGASRERFSIEFIQCREGNRDMR